MQDVKRTQFSDCFRKSSPCSRWFFMYMNPVIREARENKNTLTDAMVINMNLEDVVDGEDESYVEVKQFWNQIERQLENQKRKGVKEIDWNSVISWAIIRHMLPTVTSFTILAVVAETLAIFYSYFIGNMIEYLQGKDEDFQTGVIYVLVFGAA